MTKRLTVIIFISFICLYNLAGCAKKSSPAATPGFSETTVPKTSAAKKNNTTEPKKESNSVRAGQFAFDAKCGHCHALKRPGDFTENEWITIMDRMAPKANLDPVEKENVLAYLKYNARTGY